MLQGRACLSRTHPLAATLVFVVILAVSSGIGFGQPPPSAPSAPSAASLTTELVALHAQHQVASVGEKDQLRSGLLAVAAARRQVLAALMETDPGDVLRVAVDAHLRSSLPPEVQTYVEEEAQVEGTLMILHEDRDSGSRYLYFLNARGDKLSLHFASKPPMHLLTGARIRVTGVRIGQAMALASGSASVEALTLAFPSTLGARKLLVILFNYQNNITQPYTIAMAQDAVFTQTSNFDWENSYHQTSLFGDVVGWYTIPLSSTDSTACNFTTLATYAEQAATTAGVNLSGYDGYIYAFPNNASCTWLGLGMIGGTPGQA